MQKMFEDEMTNPSDKPDGVRRWDLIIEDHDRVVAELEQKFQERIRANVQLREELAEKDRTIERLKAALVRGDSGFEAVKLLSELEVYNKPPTVNHEAQNTSISEPVKGEDGGDK